MIAAPSQEHWDRAAEILREYGGDAEAAYAHMFRHLLMRGERDPQMRDDYWIRVSRCIHGLTRADAARA